MENTTGNERNGAGAARGILLGLLIGGLSGAAAMLLLAPQSGKRTRTQLRERGIQLREQASASVKNTLDQARGETEAIAAGVREKAGRLKHLGQEKIVEQLDRASAVLDAGKAAVKDA